MPAALRGTASTDCAWAAAAVREVATWLLVIQAARRYGTLARKSNYFRPKGQMHGPATLCVCLGEGGGGRKEGRTARSCGYLRMRR